MNKALMFGTLLLLSLAAERAEARQYHYVGIHPLSADVFCEIEVPHVHAVAPYQKVQFRVYDDQYYFIGDPVGYGWKGKRHVYHGHHPVQVNAVVGFGDGVEYCYLDGPHFHHYLPPPSAEFEVSGGAYVYVGAYPRRYKRELRVYSPINTVYASLSYRRPSVTIDVRHRHPRPHLAPHVGVRVDHRVGIGAPHVRHSIGVGIGAPHVSHSVGVRVGGPSVHVQDRGYKKHKHRGKKRGHKRGRGRGHGRGRRR